LETVEHENPTLPAVIEEEVAATTITQKPKVVVKVMYIISAPHTKKPNIFQTIQPIQPVLKKQLQPPLGSEICSRLQTSRQTFARLQCAIQFSANFSLKNQRHAGEEEEDNKQPHAPTDPSKMDTCGIQSQGQSWMDPKREKTATKKSKKIRGEGANRYLRKKDRMVKIAT
jgi:hypothetical protein